MGDLVFRAGEDDSFEWLVQYHIPMQPGKYAPAKFIAKFRRFDQAKVDEMVESIENGDANARDIVDDILLGWRNVKSIEWKNGEPPRFDVDEEREWMLGIAGMSKAIFETWATAHIKGAGKN